jgi:hypothetical protein
MLVYQRVTAGSNPNKTMKRKICPCMANITNFMVLKRFFRRSLKNGWICWDLMGLSGNGMIEWD